MFSETKNATNDSRQYFIWLLNNQAKLVKTMRFGTEALAVFYNPETTICDPVTLKQVKMSDIRLAKMPTVLGYVYKENGNWLAVTCSGKEIWLSTPKKRLSAVFAVCRNWFDDNFEV